MKKPKKKDRTLEVLDFLEGEVPEDEEEEEEEYYGLS